MTVYELYEKLEKLIEQERGELDVRLNVDSGLYSIKNLELDVDVNDERYISIVG